MQTSISRRIVIALAMGCFIASLCLPAFSHSDSPTGHQIESVPGWMPLAWGWIAMIFIQPPAFAWLANPFFIISVWAFFKDRYVFSMWLTASCLVLGTSFFLLSALHPMLVVFSGNGLVLYNPQPKIGFVVWMAAFFLVFLGAMYLRSTKVS